MSDFAETVTLNPKVLIVIWVLDTWEQCFEIWIVDEALFKLVGTDVLKILPFCNLESY